MFNQKI